MELKDTIQNIELLNIYENLLTENQKNILQEYYYQDLSLSEIANNYNITRQAVRDIINRSTKILQSYESKLKLSHKFSNSKELLNNLINIETDTNKIKIYNEIINILED